MTDTALVQIQGGRWDGSLFEILIDPMTNLPPTEFSISEDGLVLISQTNPPHEIGRLYGSNSSGAGFLAPDAAVAVTSNLIDLADPNTDPITDPNGHKEGDELNG